MIDDRRCIILIVQKIVRRSKEIGTGAGSK